MTPAPSVRRRYRSNADHLNTPRLVADATGTRVWRWDQAEPFGNNPADEDPDANSVAFDLPLRLPGQRYDKETNLHYNYFRDYDPSLGIYKQSDLVGIRAGLNTYAYVGSNPLALVDQYGLAGQGATDLKVCDQYLDQYSRYKCRYYLAAYAICLTADYNPVFRRDPAANPQSLQCVRVCLVNEDSAAHQRRQANCTDGCLTDKEIDDYHRSCFTKCGLNPNTYPGVGPLN